MPWYPPSAFATSGLPVNARATRTAIITASVPEFAKRMRSIEPTRSHSICDSRIVFSCGAAKHAPCPSWAWIAATTSGWAWPWMSDV